MRLCGLQAPEVLAQSESVKSRSAPASALAGAPTNVEAVRSEVKGLNRKLDELLVLKEAEVMEV